MLKNNEITITISDDTANALLEIADRYFFNLFESITTNEVEEYIFRNAILDVAKKINEELKDGS